MHSNKETGKDVSHDAGAQPNFSAKTACSSDQRISHTENVDPAQDRERMSSINAGAVHQLENGAQA